MPSMMNLSKEDLSSLEKCGRFTVSIIECGKIGFPYACLFADAGFKVVGVNTNPHMFRLLEKGRTTFFREANHALEKHVKKGIFIASSDARYAVSESNIVVIAFPVAIDRRKKPDYSLLEKACKEIGMGLRKDSLVLFASTTGPGTVEGFLRLVLERTSGLVAGVDFGLAYNVLKANSRERLSQVTCSLGVVGAIDESSLEIASLILSRITKSKIIKVSSVKTAEAINLFHNIHAETDLALANELAFLCEKLQIDFLEVLKVVNKDGSVHLPLPGVMSDSIRSDSRLLLEEAENVNLNLHLIYSAEKINEGIVDYTFRLVKDALKVCGKTVRRAKVSVLGISRFPNVKESPEAITMSIINLLKKKTRIVQIYDPFFSQKELKKLGFEGERLSQVVRETDCIIVLVGHSKFGRLSLKKVKFLAKKSPAIVDISLVIDPLKAEKYGFVYRGLGRGIWTK